MTTRLSNDDEWLVVSGQRAEVGRVGARAGCFETD
jgi:hypothetical protein